MERAPNPEDLSLVLANGQVATGIEEIQAAYATLVNGRPTFAPGTSQPTLRSGDLALTSTWLTTGALTAEVARRQPDGTWLWVLDHPAFA